jgi:hypothetical protein
MEIAVGWRKHAILAMAQDRLSDLRQQGISSRAVFQPVFSNCGVFKLTRYRFFYIVGVMSENAIQQPQSPLENFFRAAPFRFRFPHMSGKLLSEFQSVSIHCVILFLEGQFLEGLRYSFVPSYI